MFYKYINKNKSFYIFIFLITLFIFAMGILFDKDRIYFLYIMLLILSLFSLFSIYSYMKFKEEDQMIREFIENKNDLANNLKDNKLALEIVRLNEKLNEIHSTNELEVIKFKEYVTIWTHQIKSPIFALELLLNNQDIDKTKAKNELFEIEEYVQNILGFIRMHSDTTDYSFNIISLDELIKRSIKKYSFLMISNKNKLKYIPIDIKILTDSKWFLFIIDQVLSNANKYTREGEINIYLENLDLIIEDTGIGICESDLPRVFELGFTGNNGRINKKSTGIGLSLAKDIANKLLLDIRIESKKHCGTRVLIDLSKITKM